MASIWAIIIPARGKRKQLTIVEGDRLRLYAKGPDQKRFAPCDCTRGRTVGNLIYATIFNVETVEQAESLVSNLAFVQEANPGIEFEFRKF